MLAIRDLWVVPPGSREPAVRGVSLEVGDGEWLAVTGPNGCGKSSLALAAAGLWPACHGSVEAHGAPLPATPAGRAGAGVAVVLQEPSSQLFEPTVAEEIAFTLRNLAVDEATIRERVALWSSRLGLEPEMARSPQELSAGVQQRVLLAAALATAPRILVVDEGTAHLDSPARQAVLEVIRAERARGLSILWVTQEAEELGAADRVIRMERPGVPPPGESNPPAPGGRPEPTRMGRGFPRAAGGACVARVRISSAEGGSGPRVSHPGGMEFELRAGLPAALTGPNGSGKSVTLEAIAGVIDCPQVAVAWVWEQEHPPILVAQFPELQIFGDTVRDEIAFALRERHGEAAGGFDLAAELLAEFELDARMLARSPWQLSAGERRLVQIVSALVAPASALLLDEPTCGLDSRRADRLGEVLADFSRGRALAVATQDPALVSRIGARNRVLGGRFGPPSLSGKMD